MSEQARRLLKAEAALADLLANVTGLWEQDERTLKAALAVIRGMHK